MLSGPPTERNIKPSVLDQLGKISENLGELVVYELHVSGKDMVDCDTYQEIKMLIDKQIREIKGRK